MVYLQGDIELLQFADKPDVAYDLCNTIAPDCGGPFSQYTGPILARNNDLFENEININREYTYAQPTDLNLIHLPTGDNERNLYDHVNENQAVNVKNESEGLWATASRDLSAPRPFWQGPDFTQIGQFPASTEAGKLLFTKRN